MAGASSGIGAAIGAELRHRGWRVSGLSRRAPPQASVDRAFSCDVTERAALRCALDAARDALGPVDALVWCAAVPAMGRTLDVPQQAARAAFETSFWSMEDAVRAVVPPMIQRGSGAILAVLSLAALRAVPYEAHYAAAKAAAARWLECLAHEVEPRGVRVKTIFPGYVDTGFLERGGWWGFDAVPRVRGSGVSPEDVARAAAALLEGGGTRAIVGWREKAIALADRFAPGLYDRVLRRRA